MTWAETARAAALSALLPVIEADENSDTDAWAKAKMCARASGVFMAGCHASLTLRDAPMSRQDNLNEALKYVTESLHFEAGGVVSTAELERACAHQFVTFAGVCVATRLVRRWALLAARLDESVTVDYCASALRFSASGWSAVVMAWNDRADSVTALRAQPAIEWCTL